MTKQVVTGRVAMGIDGSLQGTGLVAVPFDYGLDWSKVARAKLGASLDKGASEVERVRRIDFICTRMMEFAEEHGVTDVFMEEYAISAKNQAYSRLVAELSGNLKRDVVIGLGLPLTVVPPATARTVLGKFSARAKKGQPKPVKIKVQVQRVLKLAGLPVTWDGDETDAWVCVNWGLSGIDGAHALILREAA